MSDTGKLAVRGAVFVAWSDYAMQGISVLFSIVLMRILDPEDFGVLAMATVIYDTVAIARRLGLPDLLIAQRELSSVDIGTQLALSTGLTVLVGIICLALVPVLSRFYEARILLVLVVLSFLHLLDNQGLGSTSEALLKKDLRYARLSAINVAGTITSLALAVGAALAGWGVWALVLREGTRIAMVSLGTWLLLPSRPKLGLNRERAMRYLRQGWHLWIASLSTHTVHAFDDFLVGNLLGVTPLGYYSRAYHYAQLSMSPLAPVYSVAQPTYARLQDDRARLSKAYEMVLDAIALVAFPVAGLMALVATELVVVVLGSKWLPIAPLLRFLLPYSLLRPLMDSSLLMPIALGHPEIVGRVAGMQALSMLLICTGMTLAFGAPGAALSAAIVTLIGLWLLYRHFLSTYVDVHYARILAPPLISLVLAVAATTGVFHLIPISGDLCRLFGKVSVAGLLYIGILLVWQGHQVVERIRYVLRMARG